MSLMPALRRRSIERRLLFLITGLLVVTVSVFWLTAYRQIERVALTSAGERLLTASAPIRGRFEESARRHVTVLQRVASDPAVTGFLRTGAGRDAALAALTSALRVPDTNPLRIQLRDARGQIVLESSADGVMRGSGWIERSIQRGDVAAGEVQLSPIWAAGQTSYSETLTGVSHSESAGTAAVPNAPKRAPIGYIAEISPVVAQGLETIRALVGPQAVLLVGAPGEGEWTDLERPSRPAPAQLRVGEALVFDTSAWGAGVGAASAIRGTPWVLWVHQPRSLILTSARRLTIVMSLLALFVVLAGVVSAWLLGRWITRPIVRLTSAAEKLAVPEGEPSGGPFNNLDEIERLSDAFARMSARVQESHDALVASERRFRSLIENASDPITIVDADGLVRYASPAHARVLGHAAAELIDQPIARHADPEDVPPLGDVLRDLRETPGATIDVTARLRHRNGSWRLLAGSATNLLNEPSIAGIVLNWRDVTEQAALEAQLRDAQRMEAIGRLAGGIAHDLNNILTAITSFSQFAADAIPPGSIARDDVGQVELAAQRATALTKQLLVFSRQQVLRPRPLDLNAVVRQLESMLRRLIRADVSLRAELAPSLGRVLADPAQIEQVVLNLVLNARDAMPNGGSIVIETADVELSRDYARQHPEVHPGAHVMLSVTDSGFGMNPETMSHIFEPFYTTKAIGHGTGLGLATVYGITKQSGGSIWIQSQVGLGSVFKVYFPRHSAPIAAPIDEKPPLPGEVEAATVLLVEDDLAVQQVARRVLETAGHSVHCAGNGREALTVAGQLSTHCDLLVTDLVMPDMGGQELALRLSERWPAVRILFMSGYTADTVNRDSLLRPQDAFIEKPFTPRALAEKAALVLRGRALRSQRTGPTPKRSAQ